MRLALFIFLVGFGCSGKSAQVLDGATNDGQQVDTAVDGAAQGAVLPLGTVSGVTAITCASGLPSAAVCSKITVNCPGVPALQAEIAITQPSTTLRGTAVLHFGGGGTAFFDQGFPAGYLAAGLRVVQMRWATDWPASPGGSIKAAACRPATVIQWAFDNAHAASRSLGFCVQGHSGGSGALGYALAHYGLGSIIDYAMEDAGPVFGRIDYGCEPSLSGQSGTTRYICPLQPNGPFAYSGAASIINTWETSSTCGTPYGDSSAADRARWAADSVVSPGATFAYPKTEVSFWYCANNSNEATGQGAYMADEVTTTKSINCIAGSCQTEPYWTDPQGKQTMINAMATSCVPHHQ